jgi:hypothetical protein
MISTSRIVRTVENVAEAYVASRGKSRFVSTTLAIRAIRTVLPTCEATDRDITDIIAATSIRHNIPVAFDGTIMNEIETENDGAFFSRASESSLQ